MLRERERERGGERKCGEKEERDGERVSKRERDGWKVYTHISRKGTLTVAVVEELKGRHRCE